MHVLVVGGTGLISTGITRQLVAAGHDVTCFTRARARRASPIAVDFVHGDRNEAPDLVYVPTDLLRDVAPERTEMLRDHFQFSTVFDNGKAKRDLGFEDTISFREGVERTIDWLVKRDGIDPWDAENDDAIVDAWREVTATVENSLAE